jgi:hypothetical protein
VSHPLAALGGYNGCICLEIGGRIVIGAGGGQRFGISHSGGSGWVAGNVVAEPNHTYLMVVRITCRSGPDKIGLFINPPLGPSLPATPDAVRSDDDLGAFIDCDFGGGVPCQFDELRYGTSSASVTPTR